MAITIDAEGKKYTIAEARKRSLSKKLIEKYWGKKKQEKP